MAVVRQDIPKVAKWPDAVTTLCDEHRYMNLLLNALEEKIQGEDEIPEQDYFLIHDIVRYMHEYPDAVHHPTEDLMFDKLITRDPATQAVVHDLQRDHEKLTGNTDRILSLLRTAEAEQSIKAADAVRQACKRYIDRLRAHIQKEEAELFPRAIECLAPRDWRIIEARLNDVDDPLFGRTVDSRFRVLFEYFSAQAGAVSRRITLFSFLQFDRFIESTDSLEQGAGEMLAMIREHIGAMLDESKTTWRQTMDSRDPGAIISKQYRLIAFLSRKAVNVGSDATGIYWKTAKQMAAPFLTRRQDS